MFLIRTVTKTFKPGSLKFITTMATSVHETAKSGFVDGSKYEQGRPSYTEEAVQCITDIITESVAKSHSTGTLSYEVLELGAGTGKFTQKIISKLQQDVRYLATEPMGGFLETLKELCPMVTTQIAQADSLPLPDASVKNVLAAQCFHWFATEKSLKEIHRVLAPGGNFVCVWNNKDWGVPWVHGIEDILTSYYGDTPRAVNRDWKKAIEDFAGFQTIDHKFLPGIHFQGDREFIVDHFCTISVIASLPDDEKTAVRQRMSAVLDRYGDTKDKDSIVLPFQTEIYHSNKS